MADTKPTSNYYRNFGGIDIKASEYSTDKARFLDLRNLDFDVPNALQKRPGSTFAVTTGTSGPISSLFEYVKLDGTSYIVAGSDTAMFYIASQQFTLLSSGWNNGQPTDMLTFVNKLWMANGQKWESWGGTLGVAPVQAGLPMQQSVVVPVNGSNGASIFTVGGATVAMAPSGGTSWIVRGVYVAYSYVRNDGYQGPADFLQAARNVMGNARPATTGDEYFNTYTYAPGITIPANYGISAIQLWVAVDTVTNDSATMFLDAGLPYSKVGNLGWEDRGGGISQRRMSFSLHPNADLSRFHLFTTIPGSSLGINTGLSGYNPPTNFGAAGSMWVVPFALNTSNGFDQFNSVATGDGFSGVPFNFFATYTPKYIEVSQNIMFMAGFSSQPSVVWFSEVGEPEYLSPNNNFEVRTNDGDRILALSEFQNQMFIFKETSFHKLSGDSVDSFQLIQLSNEVGCLSNKTVIEYDQFLIWLDKKGIVRYNGANYDVISVPIENVFRRMNLTAARERACAVYHLYRNQVWFGIPVDGSTVNNLTVVYDYLADAFTFFDGFDAASFAFNKGQLSVPSVWRGDYSGFVHYHGSSFFSDSGRGITCLALTRFEQYGGENETSIWRRFFLDVNPATGVTGEIKGQVFSNYDQSSIQATFSIYQTQFQTRAEMGVVGKAAAAQLSHSSASLPLLINGYSWAKRPLRNV